MPRNRLVVLLVSLSLLIGLAVPAAAQHGPLTGHLIGTGAFGNLELVSKLRVHDAEPDVIADLTVFKNYIYVAKWGAADCAGPERGGQNTPDGGAYVIDISDIAHPREVGFIATSQDTLVGEGMQGLTLTTSAFSGDVLVMNHEGCGKNFKAGFSLWNITNPLKPVKLSEHFGDFTTDGLRNRPHVANEYHSAFAWDAGDRAYLIATDDDETRDVDIFDITDPKKPTLVSETNFNQYDVWQPTLGLTDSFLHDMVVKQIGGRFIALLSYWDGGYILVDVTSPRTPVFLGDSDFAAVDPELLAQTGVALTPEGNGHEAEFTLDNKFAITTDEDFGPFRLLLTTVDGTFGAAPGSQTSKEQAEAVSGKTVFVGRACPGDPAVPSAATAGGDVAVVERGLCLFEEKAQNVIAAGGWKAMLIMNREGADGCTGVFSPSLAAPIPTIFVGRDTGFAMFNLSYDDAACRDANFQRAPIAIGTFGDPIQKVASQFDGWGYVHLFGVDLGTTSGSLTELDTFAIPEAMNPAYASGFGALSVHEVATDKTDARRAYLSYYAGGIRALQISCHRPSDRSTCRLVETGGYLDPNGNQFWGIETFVRDGVTYVAGSDMDYGVFIVKRKP
ncbi:MAG TPA: PA domain-containing protein [Candidatus Limnocylindria bacterium]|nr:PA domain-containing protein [Candidatus Limnocylindria bacterium]